MKKITRVVLEEHSDGPYGAVMQLNDRVEHLEEKGWEAMGPARVNGRTAYITMQKNARKSI